MAHEYFDKTLDVMIKRYGDDSVKLIPIYQALGRVSFIASRFGQLHMCQQWEGYRFSYSVTIRCKAKLGSEDADDYDPDAYDPDDDDDDDDHDDDEDTIQMHAAQCVL